ncbi:MAG TPA: anti-phage protein KwaA [Symbiobacteriaceae bacterium]|nr:anti-phage protein KwaA [Symbiobacteriaceae bacterium]
MLRKYVKIFLFISSYTPLFLILLIKDLNVAPTCLTDVFLHPAVAVSMLVGLGAANFLLWRLFRTVKRLQRKSLQVAEVESRNAEALNYLATYVIPFLGIDLGSVRDIISILLVFVVMATLYIRSNLLHTNPVLSQLGFHIYEVSVSGGDRVVLITRSRVKPGTTVKVVHFSDNVYLEGE